MFRMEDISLSNEFVAQSFNYAKGIENVSRRKEQQNGDRYSTGLQVCRNVGEFMYLGRIGENASGLVCRAMDRQNGKTVALKRIRLSDAKEEIPLCLIREVTLLMQLQHENVVTMREIVVNSDADNVFIVLEFVDHDLYSLIKRLKRPFTIGQAKNLMSQVLSAVGHLHENLIIHRDLKPANLLLTSQGVLKVSNFELAYQFKPTLGSPDSVDAPLWYRAPELLFLIKQYSFPVDIWSVGCIFGELLTLKPMFQGENEVDQIRIIFDCLGTPNDKIWPGFSQVVKNISFCQQPYNYLRSEKLIGVPLTDKGFKFINKLLIYYPEKRATAKEALKDDFFTEKSRPCNLSDILSDLK